MMPARGPQTENYLETYPTPQFKKGNIYIEAYVENRSFHYFFYFSDFGFSCFCVRCWWVSRIPAVPALRGRFRRTRSLSGIFRPFVTWDSEPLEFWLFGILNFGDFEFLELWPFGILTFWNFEFREFWTFWNFDLLEFWTFWNFWFWNSVISEFWNSGSPQVDPGSP